MTNELWHDYHYTIEDPSQMSYSWWDMAELTHETQVARYNWCACEEQEQFPYNDCPRLKTGEAA